MMCSVVAVVVMTETCPEAIGMMQACCRWKARLTGEVCKVLVANMVCLQYVLHTTVFSHLAANRSAFSRTKCFSIPVTTKQVVTTSK